MEEILKKYYEYFIKGNFQDRIHIGIGSEFNDFYKMIIGAYDISQDKVLHDDLLEFFKFFDKVDSFGWRQPSLYSTFYGALYSKSNFESFNKASFEWFDPTEYMVNNKSFVYSINGSEENVCKAYISIKPKEYVKVLIKLQSFVNQLFENHPNEAIGECKFRRYPANDGIVMRFSKEEHYHELLEFLDNNQDILDAFDTPNIFMPQNKYGISLISDKGGSYNYFVTRMIWDYMFDCREKNVDVSILGIVEFINNYDCSNDKMLYENGDEILSDFRNILIGKLTSKSNEEILSNVFNKKNKVLHLNK